MRQHSCNRRGVPDQNVDDPLDVVEVEDRNTRLRQRRIGCNSDNRWVLRMEQRLAERGTVEFKLRMRLAFVAFDQHEIDRAELREQNRQRWLGFGAQLVNERPTLGRTDQNLGRSDYPMGVRILAGLVDVEGVVGVLERRHSKTTRNDAWDHFGNERGLARAAPAGEADNAHAAL